MNACDSPYEATTNDILVELEKGIPQTGRRLTSRKPPEVRHPCRRQRLPPSSSRPCRRRNLPSFNPG